jgi:putative membrane protein
MTAAHHPVVPAEAWAAWTWDPLVIATLIVIGAGYASGVVSVRRGRHALRRWRRARVAAFFAGLFALAAALLSPLHALGETLFSAHMVQHLVLVLVAAPLLAYGSPALPLWLALPARARAASGSLRRTRPVTAARALLGGVVFVAVFHAVALWAWHLPRLYEAGLDGTALHALEHASFLVSAFLLWALVLGARPRHAPSRGPALAALFVTALHSSALGALLTFAAWPLYDVHRPGALAWGLRPLADQQLAGLIMWIPAGAFYVVAMGAVFLAWLREDRERSTAPTALEATE